MKTSERHRLKENDLALAVGQAQEWLGTNRNTLVLVTAAIIIVGVGVLGYLAFRNNTNSKAAGLLAQAMVVDEGQVAPPAPPAGTTNDPTNTGGQQPGTYPTLQAKLETALPKFLSAADSYPNTQAGQMARLRAAETLTQLGRTDEALKQYDAVIASGDELLSRAARLGKAGAQLAAGQHDAAISALRALADQPNSSLPVDGLLMELGRAYRLAGKTEDARKAYTEVVEKHSESPYVSDAKTEIAKLTKGPTT